MSVMSVCFQMGVSEMWFAPALARWINLRLGMMFKFGGSTVRVTRMVAFFQDSGGVS